MCKELLFVPVLLHRDVVTVAHCFCIRLLVREAEADLNSLESLVVFKLPCASKCLECPKDHLNAHVLYYTSVHFLIDFYSLHFCVVVVHLASKNGTMSMQSQVYAATHNRVFAGLVRWADARPNSTSAAVQWRQLSWYRHHSIFHPEKGCVRGNSGE